MISNYISLIQSLPVNEHGFKTNKRVWQKYEDETTKWLKPYNEIIFGSNDYRLITRGELLQFFDNQSDMRLFVLMVIYWGYPTGMRNNHFEQIIKDESIEKLCEILYTVKKKQSITNFNKFFIDNVNSLDGIALSTFSKFLYFLNINIENKKALILDLRIIDVLKNSQFRQTEFNKLNYNNAYKKYTQYLNFMENTALIFETTTDKLEMFLFIFGNVLHS